MKRVSLLLSCFATAGLLPLSAADLAGAHSVYILQMSHGMDQYLANRLTNDHVFQVVTDPKVADIILTDHIGDTFEQQLDLLLNPEPVKKVDPEPAKKLDPEPVKKVDPPPAKDGEKNADKNADKSAGPMLPFDTETKLPPVRSTFGVSKGTFFLVDPKSHQVIWSVYDLAKASDSKELDRTASDIVSRLKKDLNSKK